MAEFRVRGVNHPGNKPIEYVCAAQFDPATNTMGAVQHITRAQVISWMAAGHTFFTSLVYKDPQTGGEKWPQNARITLTKSGRYITTDPNNDVWDNLGNLPPC